MRGLVKRTNQLNEDAFYSLAIDSPKVGSSPLSRGGAGTAKMETEPSSKAPAKNPNLDRPVSLLLLEI